MGEWHAEDERTGTQQGSLLRTEMNVTLPRWSDALLDGGESGLTAIGTELLREVSPGGAYRPAGSILGPQAVLIIRLGPEGSPRAALDSLNAFLERIRPAAYEEES